MAIMGYSNGFIYYKHNGKMVATKVFDRVRGIVAIKEFDYGCAVVDLKLDNGDQYEEIVDLWGDLILLNKSQERPLYFKGVKKEDICIENK